MKTLERLSIQIVERPVGVGMLHLLHTEAGLVRRKRYQVFFCAPQKPLYPSCWPSPCDVTIYHKAVLGYHSPDHYYEVKSRLGYAIASCAEMTQCNLATVARQ